jgi:hypothetical protein
VSGRELPEVAWRSSRSLSKSYSTLVRSFSPSYNSGWLSRLSLGVLGKDGKSLNGCALAGEHATVGLAMDGGREVDVYVGEAIDG